MRSLAALLALVTGSWVSGASVLRDVAFELVADVGFGNEVVVVGTHPLLGGGDPTRGVKLAWSEGNRWRGTVALPAGENIAHRFVRRSFATSAFGDSANAAPLGTESSVDVPSAGSPPWSGKTVFLLANGSSASLLHRDLTRGGPWASVPMRDDGPGRTPGERRFRADGIAAAGSDLEFVFQVDSTWINAPAPPAIGAYAGSSPPHNFRTPLDVFLVQDGQVFASRPPASVSPPRVVSRQVDSTIPGIPGRPVSILLPRGYDESPGVRYPVVIFHDGQNVFSPGGPFGSWDADRIANHETAQGRMREAILVAVPNGNAYGSDRLQEYLPDGDTITLYGGGTVTHPGRASQYLRFLLENLMPALHAHYRTLGDGPGVVVAGSSMGGLVSDYLGHARPDRFGTVGIFSPAYWAAPRWTAARTHEGPRPRRWISMGTAESSGGESSSNVYWQGALSAYNAFLASGQAVNRDLRFLGVAGGVHNESAWARLLPAFFSFALPPTTGPVPLAAATFPPSVELIPRGSGLVARHRVLPGIPSRLEMSSDLAAWTTLASPATTDPWSIAEHPLDPAPASAFVRLVEGGP